MKQKGFIQHHFLPNVTFKKSGAGFTLIELLVVISIIGLLAAVALVSLNSARMKARDTRRKADLKQLHTALNLYYDSYGSYPPAKPSSSCGQGDVWASSHGNCGGQWLTTDPNFYQFMLSVPVDPLNTGTNAGWGDGNIVYSYYPSLTNNQEYELLTQLESPTDPDRCGNRAAYYHNAVPALPWCAPWPNSLNRSQNIYADH